MTNKELAELMYPKTTLTIEDYEKKYPKRDLPDGAVVSRYAPSPTGFVHMGNMLSCFIENKIPKQTKGVFYLRIEDTDQKREVEGGISNIIDAMHTLGLDYNEGVISENEQKGAYGPYIQSERVEIYNTFAKYMIENNLAYPCFCSAEELDETRNIQMARKERIGYYGPYAKCRNLTNEERAERIKRGDQYTIRLRSVGNFERKIKFHDLVKGNVLMPENDLDIVLIKSDGIPVYHFAHLVDDHLMHTTHVLRGEDWLSSVPIHLQLFDMFHFDVPKYAHLGLIMIVDENGNKRKISKRKDVNFTVKHYHEEGIPEMALQEYLMTIANTSFESWRNANPNVSLDEYKFDFTKVGSSPLFDYSKLVNISKNYISKLPAHEVYENLLKWTKEFDLDFNQLLLDNKEYATNILNIEREQKKPRKDYASYSEIKNQIWYMFDELFNNVKHNYDYQTINDKTEINNILNTYISKYYQEDDDKEAWWNGMVNLCNDLGYTTDMKAYRENPTQFKGSIADVSTVIRVSLTTSSQTPDLYEIMHLLGKERIVNRINDLNK